MLGAMADGGIFLNRMRWCVPVVLLAACAHEAAPDSSALGVQKIALTYVEQQKLHASDAQANDRFGNAMATDGASVIVGAPYHAVATKAGAGAAYVFVRSGGT
jgi:hypothetical protein